MVQGSGDQENRHEGGNHLLAKKKNPSHEKKWVSGKNSYLKQGVFLYKGDDLVKPFSGGCY